MTNPVPITQGQPDFQALTATAKIIIINKSESIAAQKVYPICYAGNMPYMHIRVGCVVKAQVVVSWYADSAASIALGSDVIVTCVPGLGTAEGALPIRGPYVRFTVDLTAYSNTINLSAVASPSRHNQAATGTGENTLIQTDPQLIGAMATVNIDAATTRWGWAYWRGVLEASVSTRIKLYCIDFAGTARLLDYCNHDLASGGRLVLVPPLPLRIQVFNNSAGGLDFYSSLAFHPVDN